MLILLLHALRHLAHRGTTESRSRLAIKLFSIKCHHAGTFPAVHRLQHPLVIAFVWGHPLSAHAVRGEIPVPLLRRGHCPPFVSSQNNNPKYKISLALFPLDGSFCFLRFYLSLWPSARPRVCSPVATIHSALHKPMISLPFFPLKLLTPSLSSALPFFFFFFLFLSPPFPFFSRSLSSFHSKWCLWATKSGPVLVSDVRVCV